MERVGQLQALAERLGQIGHGVPTGGAVGVKPFQQLGHPVGRLLPGGKLPLQIFQRLGADVGDVPGLGGEGFWAAAELLTGSGARNTLNSEPVLGFNSMVNDSPGATALTACFKLFDGGDGLVVHLGDDVARLDFPPIGRADLAITSVMITPEVLSTPYCAANSLVSALAVKP